MEIEKLQLTTINNQTSYSNISIGNSKFTDDIWDLSPLISMKTLNKCRKIINFDYIKSNDIKAVAKLYAYYRLGSVKAQTVVTDINTRLTVFVKYAELKGIMSFKELTKDIFLDYYKWLKEKEYSSMTGYTCLLIIEQIIKIGKIKGWNVTETDIFSSVNSMELFEPRSLKHNQNKVQPIPKDIFDKILFYVVNKDRDILTKAGIIIQSQTGLRINEVLSIKEGCICTTSDGYDYMTVSLAKTEKSEPVVHKVFINELVKKVIAELQLFTEKLRKESGMQELFLKKSNKSGIRVLKGSAWSSNQLKNFIERWDIRDKKGDLYPLNSHQFRATFVRELIKQKVPISIIMKQFAHVSIEMTAHYLTLENDEIKEIYSDMILSPDSKIAGLRAKEIRSKLDEQFRGKAEQEIDDIVSNLSKSMSFNPLPTGVCLYDFRRGNCSDGDGCFFYNCPNYVTEIKFYPVLKQELDLMEKEMARYKELDRERDWQRQYVKYKYLKPLVNSLEVQMNGKEA